MHENIGNRPIPGDLEKIIAENRVLFTLDDLRKLPKQPSGQLSFSCTSEKQNQYHPIIVISTSFFTFLALIFTLSIFYCLSYKSYNENKKINLENFRKLIADAITLAIVTDHSFNKELFFD